MVTSDRSVRARLGRADLLWSGVEWRLGRIGWFLVGCLCGR